MIKQVLLITILALALGWYLFEHKQKPLHSLEKKLNSYQSDIIIFSFDGPTQLYALLESMHKYIENIGQIAVVYRSSLPDFSLGYEKIKSKFSQVKFLEQGKEPKKDFKQLVLKALNDSLADHIAFVVDDVIVKDTVDLKTCIQAMEEIGAYGFYLRLGKHIDYCYMQDKPQKTPLLTDRGGIFSWQFGLSEGDWNYPNNVDFTIYRKEEVVKRLRKLDFYNPKTLESLWAEKGNTKNKIGLCFQNSKIVNIPLNLVEPSSNRSMNSYSKQELLTQFLAGFKIDIAPFHQIENNSAHMEYEITFIGNDND